MIPLLDVGATYRELKNEIDYAIGGVLSSGHYIGGSPVETFESAFAEYVGADHCVSTGSGLDALTLALTALGIGPGDGVIVPANTFIATWLAVSAVGARIQPVEPDVRTGNIDAAAVEAAITPETRVIIPVHLYGQSCDLDPILEIATRRGLFVVEDAAQAHGASYAADRIGARGDLVCWSFYPGKNLGAFGDGGAVTTKAVELADAVRLLTNYGSTAKYVHEIQGTNSRLDALQAAILSVKLKHLDRWNERRRRVADQYFESLDDIDLSLPHRPAYLDAVWHLFVIRHPRRDELRRFLSERGIGTGIHYPIPPHLQQAYAHEFYGQQFPISEELAETSLSLPIGPHLSNSDQAEVISAVRSFAGR